MQRATRKKRSVIWTTDTAIMAAIVASCRSYREILSRLKLCPKGSNFVRLKKRLSADGIDTKSIDETPGWKYASEKVARPLHEILVKDSPFTSSLQKLKKRLVRAGLLKDECSECGSENSWNGKPLTLQLDHLNGDSCDFRLVNLRILCPNCHSQTPTFSGRNAKWCNRQHA